MSSMRNRTIVLALSLLALLFWGGLIVLVNNAPPDALRQGLFLLLWALAVLATAMPVAYGLNARFARALGQRGNLNRALRQAVFVSVTATVMMGLRFVRALSPLTVIILVVIAVILEALFHVRPR
jgi:hypothetical protein